MKNFLLCFLFVFSLNAVAFNYTINFAGLGGNAVGDVLVQNLTQNTSILVPAGNVLNLTDVPTALQLLNSTDKTLRVSSDVALGCSTVSFYTHKAGATQFSVLGVDGRKIAGINQQLPEGENTFQLSLPTGAYLIQVSANGSSYSSKLIQPFSLYSQPQIHYLGNNPNSLHAVQKTKKGVEGITSMFYTTGDVLLYKALSGNLSTVITDIPTGDKTTAFNFVTCQDADNNNYTTVTIGTQTWMAENLKTTHYRNAESIDNVTDNIAWDGLTTGAWCDFENDAANGSKYGHLYNFYAVSDSRNIAHVGWHVSTDAEWTTLSDFLGGDAVAGGKLKEAGTLNWASPNTGATNETGFTALGGGVRNDNQGSFSPEGDYYGYWWTSTPVDLSPDPSAWKRSLNYSLSNLLGGMNNQKNGFSVRCVKD